MSLRERINKLFEKSKPEAGPVLDAAAATQEQKIDADKERDDERKARAVEAKTAELLRPQLTPDYTIYGTQPKTPPTEKQARERAEKIVAAEAARKEQGMDHAGNTSKTGMDQRKDSERDARTNDPLMPNEVTPAYIAEVEASTAVHEAEQDSGTVWTPEERAAAIAAERADREAREAQQLGNELDPGRHL